MCQAFFVRPFHMPLAGMAMRRSGPNQCRELKGSLRKSGFPDPDLVDRVVLTVLVLLTSCRLHSYSACAAGTVKSS